MLPVLQACLLQHPTWTAVELHQVADGPVDIFASGSSHDLAAWIKRLMQESRDFQHYLALHRKQDAACEQVMAQHQLQQQGLAQLLQQQCSNNAGTMQGAQCSNNAGDLGGKGCVAPQHLHC